MLKIYSINVKIFSAGSEFGNIAIANLILWSDCIDLYYNVLFINLKKGSIFLFSLLKLRGNMLPHIYIYINYYTLWLCKKIFQSV